jgi:hypothetical protein
MTQGRSIRLFLVDGTPTGIITAEIMNWTGHVIIAPRSLLADFVQRGEAGRTGVYFLVGENPESALKPLVYIGETDNVGKRLIQHNKDDAKGYFDRICVVTSKDQNLTKAHARYLESRLIAIAAKAGSSAVQNNTAPDFALLPEADLSDMEFFIEQIRIVLPVLGLNFLRESGPTLLLAKVDQETSTSVEVISGGQATRARMGPMTAEEMGRAFYGRYRPSSEGKASPVFEIRDEKNGLVARAVEIDGQMVIIEGSQVRKDEMSSLSSTLKQRRRDYVNSGILVGNAAAPNLLVFTTDVAFNSPSQASDMVFARASNGRMEWVIPETKQTYAAWQQAQIAARAPKGGDE